MTRTDATWTPEPRVGNSLLHLSSLQHEYLHSLMLLASFCTEHTPSFVVQVAGNAQPRL